MKQICYRCGLGIDLCICEWLQKRPGHRATDEDGQAFAERHPQELLDYMLQSDYLRDILSAYQKEDPEEFLHLACCAAEAYADNHGMEAIG